MLSTSARFGRGQEFRLFSLVDYRHYHAVYDYVQNPTYRPTVIEHFGRVDRFARRVDPHDAEYADAEKVGYHWSERIAHSAHATHQNFDYAADEIDGQNDFHSVASVLNYDGIGRVQARDILPCREQNKRPKKAYHDYHYGRFESGLFDALGFLCGVVLPCKRDGCVGYGVH